jgi:hypothetical protein
MKYIIKESHLFEITKFDRSKGTAIDNGEYSDVIKKLALHYIKIPICDLAVIKGLDKKDTKDGKDYYIILFITNYGHNVRTLEYKLTTFIQNFLPISVMVLPHETSDKCPEYINQ